jgi:hypothetical protein
MPKIQAALPAFKQSGNHVLAVSQSAFVAAAGGAAYRRKVPLRTIEEVPVFFELHGVVNWFERITKRRR